MRCDSGGYSSSIAFLRRLLLLLLLWSKNFLANKRCRTTRLNNLRLLTDLQLWQRLILHLSLPSLIFFNLTLDNIHHRLGGIHVGLILLHLLGLQLQFLLLLLRAFQILINWCHLIRRSGVEWLGWWLFYNWFGCLSPKLMPRNHFKRAEKGIGEWGALWVL